MSRISSYSRRIALDAVLLTFAIIISYIESMALSGVVFLHMPGFKLGLANIIVMYAFFSISKADAFAISLLRVVIIGILFGNATSFVFSVFGAVFAYVFMLSVSRLYGKYLTYIGVSVGCAAMHNVGQLTAASILISDVSIFAYLSWLLVVAAISGTLSGVLTNYLDRRLKAGKIT